MSNKDKNMRMQDWHKLFVQSIMSHGFMTGQDVYALVKKICEEYNGTPGFPSVRFDQDQSEVTQDIAALIDNFLKTANNSLEKIQFQIKKGHEETKTGATYMQFYAFVPLEENEQIAKLQKNLTEPELEFLKLITYHLIDERPDGDTENNLINLCMQGGLNAAKKKLTSIEAAKSLRSFLEQGYLAKIGVRKGKTGGRVGVGVRLLLELEGWLERNTEVAKCSNCTKPVVITVSCNAKSCDGVFHKRCVETKSRCTVYKQTLKLDGVAAKR